MNRVSDLETTDINWKRGALRLWVVAATLWCVAVFSVGLLQSKNVRWFPVASATVHVKISNTETWDYPADWGVERIRDDLEKRLAAKDEKNREWAAHAPAYLRNKCNAIPPTTQFVDQPSDCVRLLLANDMSVVPYGWESQVTVPDASAWSIIAAAMPWAIVPPLGLLALGTSLFWVFAGFRHSDSRP